MVRRQYRWTYLPQLPELVSGLSARHHVPELVAQILLNRGLAASEDIEAFLDPSLNRLLPPTSLKDMDRAVARLAEAVRGSEPIAVYGDYDVDGVSATALLVDFFRTLGVPTESFIPDRLTQGYGLHGAILAELAKRARVLVTVDCGISNRAEVAEACRLGLDVIITDHHEVPSELPEAVAVINPKRSDCDYDFKELAGVGVALNLILGIRTRLREMGWFRDRPEPNLRAYLDLVALGTAADVVPLIGVNRILTHQGLKVLSEGRRPGITALKEVARLGDRPVALREVIFRLAPRLNAAGRLGQARGALELLLADDLGQGRILARHLDGLNQRRQAIEREILRQAEVRIRGDKLQDQPALVLAGADWHPGVIGIVAAKLADAYHRPTVLISIQGEQARGSARSIPIFNLYAGLSRCREHFLHFGGHPAAAGFTLPTSRLDAFREDFLRVVADRLGTEPVQSLLEVDAEAELADMNEEFFFHLDRLRPFGQGNPEPVLACLGAEVLGSRVVGESHLRIKLGTRKHVIDAIAFDRGRLHPLSGYVDVAFSPRLGYFQGRPAPEYRVVDLGSAAEK